MNLLNVMTAQARRRSAIIAALFLGFLMAALSFMALTFVQTAGIYPSWRYYGGFLVVGAGITALMCQRYRLKIAIGTGTGFLVSMLVLVYCDPTPAKTFRRLDAAIQYGMTLAEVRTAVQRESLRPGQFSVRVLPVTESGDEEVTLSATQALRIMDSRFGFDMCVVFLDGQVCLKDSNLALGSDMALPTVLAMVAALACLWCWLSARQTRRAGHGIDAASLAERLKGVRRDYVGQSRGRHQVICQRRDLLAWAGQAVRRFAYFRERLAASSRGPEDEHKHR